jgi:chitin synthase
LEQEYWWDVARVTSRDFEVEQMQLKSRAETFKILFKLFAYVVFFMFVLVSAVTNKITLFTMINSLKKEQVNKNSKFKLDQTISLISLLIFKYTRYLARWVLLICSSVSVPYALNFVFSLQTVLFASTSRMPGSFIFVWVLLVEVGHTFGVALLLFKILPNIENITGLLFMNGLCIVPAILRIFFTSCRGMNRIQKLGAYLLDFLAILCQLSVLVVFRVYGDFDKKPLPLNHNADSISIAESQQVPKDDMFFVYVIVSAVLISLSYWQNFTEVRFSTNRITMFLQRQINELRKHNSKIYMIVSPTKVVLMFFFAYALMPEQVQNQFSQFDKQLNFTSGRRDSGLMKMNLGTLSFTGSSITTLTTQSKLSLKQRHDIFYESSEFIIPFIIHIVSSIFCYYTARVSCKVLMQGIGFALPLSLATPVTFIVMFVSSIRVQYESIEMFTGPLSEYFFLDSFNSSSLLFLFYVISFFVIFFKIYITMFLVTEVWASILIGLGFYWLSQMWIGSHIWSPKLERMAKNER